MRGLSSCQDPHITSLSVPSGQGANENVHDLDAVEQVIIQCAAIYPVIGCFIAS